MHSEKRKRAFREPTGHRIVLWLEKAALKTHAFQMLRDSQASPNRAKRLECVRFIGAFRLARDGPRFMVPSSSKRWRQNARLPGMSRRNCSAGIPNAWTNTSMHM
jgi:hypothetical protein